MQLLESINQKIASIFSGLLSLTASLLTPERFTRLDARLGVVGNMMAPVTALLLLIMGIFGAIKTDSFMAFAASLGAIIAFYVAHLCGRALMSNCDLAIANSSSHISGYGLFRTLALLAIIGFIALLFFGVYMAIKISMMEPLYVPLAYATGILFLVWFLLNPALVGIGENPASSPGDDALSIYVFSLASSIKLHRVVFGVGLLVGNLSIAYSIIRIMRGEFEYMMQSGVAMFSGVIMVFAAALAPLALYLGFVFSYLVIDLLRSVLRIGK